MFARDSDKGETHEAVFLSLKMQKHFFSLLDVNALLNKNGPIKLLLCVTSMITSSLHHSIAFCNCLAFNI
jgi:hypothetical protein